MPSFCHDLASRYAHLRTLTEEFTTQYERVKETGDLTEVRDLRVQLKEAREALFEQLTMFVVPDATNPYHEALLEAGLDPNETQERQEMIVDIRQEIKRQLAVYREPKDADGRPLMQDWITNITENKYLIYTEVAKDRAKIVERIKNGMIPIVMPSRTVQEHTWKVALTNLKPIWFTAGTREAVDHTGLSDRYELEKMDLSGFFKNIPDRPYLVWVKPTQKSHPLTRNKSFDDQQTYHVNLVTNHPKLYDRMDLIPTEYIALQTIFTSIIKERNEELKGGTSEPTEIRPLDFDSHIRFLSTGTFSDGYVPSADFDPDSRKVCVGYDYPDAHGGHGFRPAARS